MRKYLLLPVLVTLSLTCGPVDEGAEANKRFVEAVALLEAAESEPYAPTKLALLEQAETTLQIIITRYPSTDLAVKLTSGQQIGNVSLTTVEAAVEAARGPACQVAPTAACVIAQAVALAQTLDGRWRSGALRNIIRALARIAPAQAQVGDRTGAQATLAQMLALAQTLPDEKDRSMAFLWHARTQAQVGDRARAQATLAQVRALAQTFDEKERVELLAWLAPIQAHVGDRAEAQEATSRMLAFIQTLGERRDSTLVLLLHLYLWEIDTVQVLALAQMITNEEIRAKALASIALAQVQAGNRVGAQETASQALALARTVTDEKERVYTLAHIVPALAQAGDHAEARATVAWMLARTQMMSKWTRPKVLSYIAQAQAYMGDGVQALALAQTLTNAGDDPYMDEWMKEQRVKALADIALALARVDAADAPETDFWNWLNSFW